MKRAARLSKDAGSVLVEAMVSSLIIAMTLIALYTAIIESASHSREAEERRNALMIAQSELAAVGSIIPSTPGVTEGTQGDFIWRVDIEPYGGSAQPGFGTSPNPAGVLCLVRVSVGDQHRRPLAVLNTLTLARGV